MENNSTSKTAALDLPLYTLGFEIGDLSPHRVTGRLPVTHKCCQPFKVLHGGVSALIAESLASMGAHMASGFNRVAGVHLSINHLKSAVVGDEVFAEAVPITVGRTIQVWEVKLWRSGGGQPKGEEVLISSARVTLLSNMAVPENLRNAAGEALKKHAKL